MRNSVVSFCGSKDQAVTVSAPNPLISVIACSSVTSGPEPFATAWITVLWPRGLPPCFNIGDALICGVRCGEGFQAVLHAFVE